MNKIEFNNLKINLDLKICYIDDKEIPLTKTEFSLLVYLMFNKNKILSRKEIMNEVWEKEVTDRAVDTAISRLRKKLFNIGSHITTRLGFGYGFIE